jgi:hypothetical protein
MTPLLRRIVTEKRGLLVPLVVVLINIAVYALVVYPLGSRTRSASRSPPAGRRGSPRSATWPQPTRS